jgi:hypothetical protein
MIQANSENPYAYTVLISSDDYCDILHFSALSVSVFALLTLKL